MPLAPAPLPHPRRGRPRNAKGVILIGLGIVVAALAALGLTLLVLYPQLPDTDHLGSYQPKEPLRVYTADGVEIGGFGQEKRQFVPLKDMPPLMKDSLLAVEDARFYEHNGIDPVGVLRAIVSNMTGGRKQGASTITQQVARTFFLTRERTITRKLKEAMLALRIERQLSKDRILELYMNEIYLGARSYGFAEASQTYFGKPLKALSPAEAAMLAGLPQNPANANPVRNQERALKRMQVVLGRMKAAGVIDELTYTAAMKERPAIRTPGEVEVHAEHVAEMARAQVYAQYGEAAYTSGMKVSTTLNAARQRAAWNALRQTLIDRESGMPWRGPEGHESLDDAMAADDPDASDVLEDYIDDETLPVAVVTRVTPKELTVVTAAGEVRLISGKGLRQAQVGLGPKATAAQKIKRGSVLRLARMDKSNWRITQWPEADGALVALNPQDGRVEALVGGFDFKHNQFNHVTQGWRQPGSSFKPFLYSAALENGVMPETLVNDAPLTDVGDWNPGNSDGSADGPVTVREGLARSKNLVSIRLVQLVGAGKARAWASQFGFEASKHPDNLTLALGTGSTTPLQLASAYAVFANGGLKVTPTLITRITDAKGKVVFSARPKVATEADRVIPARNAFLTGTLLNEVTRSGTAARAQGQLRRPDLFGKTGTTNDVVDAWFAGYQPTQVAVVWLGYDTPRSLGSHASGASLALPAWIQYMGTAVAGRPVAMPPAPEGVVALENGWRYSEWADGGFLAGVGLDGQPISPEMIPHVPTASSGASAAESEDGLESMIRLWTDKPASPTPP
ncbi:PBP1A family penicillin-binding protein [Aquabacterium lacunae]|uniref:Penicillin-binding protein 1A n=1 Tax=Aquabacterium lacunae TaxID=2528630 RepID=A0A4Q9H5Q9_9BURK|nr:PBP1A family penicillin-binding protein [Aquabacterium lacunae]TBO32897.1 PBP1A family penicillin-binding protein [Aquabacterium lacunae]